MPEHKQPPSTLSQKFEHALAFANQVHAHQKRKDSGAPYFAHVIGVAALVLEDGGSEEEAIAALLHDTAEDQGGQAMLDEITSRFGETIAQIVAECSDTLLNPKPPWQARKAGHINTLRTARPETIRIMLADKVYNSRNLLRSLQERGEVVWENFKGGRDGTIWYFQQMYAVFSRTQSGYMLDEFGRNIKRIEAFPNDCDPEPLE
jgi:(p)ppGpp synthase/HD superfamily hydrolase